MGLFKNFFNKKTSICDVCNNNLGQYEGYLLSTKDVVTSIAYWKKVLIQHKILRSLTEKEKILEVQQIASKLASNDDPWMVCEECISLFSVNENLANKKQAKEAAIKWKITRKPSSGFALCRIEKDGLNMVVRVINDKDYRLAKNAAMSAYEGLRNYF